MFIAIARPSGASRRINGTLKKEGWGECCDYSKIHVW
jgi:hypothetical protein